jgi:Flp pilus assembly protein TadG
MTDPQERMAMSIRKWPLRIPGSTRQAEQGNALLELALIFPVVLGLCLGITDFGRLFYSATTVTNAAEAGAVYGSRSVANASNVSGIRQAVLNDAQNLSDVTVNAFTYCQCSDGSSASCNNGASCPGSQYPRTYLKVTATAPFTTAVNYPGIPSLTDVAAVSIVRVQ